MQGRTTVKKAQSAMEYLMTYGWAILTIAVVLASLFSLGVFNGSNINGSTCIASPGYLCISPVYSHADGNIIATLGQSTGASWVTANFVFVGQGTAFNGGVPAVSFTSAPANILLSSTGMQSGGEASLYLPATGAINVGTPISGTIWAQYTYKYYSAGVQQTISGYVQIASLNLKAS